MIERARLGGGGGGSVSNDKYKQRMKDTADLHRQAADQTSKPGADSICPERARSAGSRTALAPLQFRKMGCQNERKKLAQIRYQVTCYGIKLESGDLPRFFMIDEIDHARLEEKNSSDCLCQRVRADAVVLARLSFSEASLALSCE